MDQSFSGRIVSLLFDFKYKIAIGDVGMVGGREIRKKKRKKKEKSPFFVACDVFFSKF